MKPLFEAAQKDELDTLRAATPEALRELDVHGATLLHWAGSLRIVEALLEAGIEADSPDREGKSPLYWHSSQADIVRLLLSRGADPTRHGTLGGATPVHRAAESNAVESLRAMLAAGAPVDIPTSTASAFPGRTPLHSAAETGAIDAARVLIAAGANVQATDAGREGYPREGGDSPLHIAVDRSDASMIRLLLEHGADAYTENNDGHVPIDRAEDKGEELRALFD